MQLAFLDMRIDNCLEKLRMRTRDIIEAEEKMQLACNEDLEPDQVDEYNDSADLDVPTASPDGDIMSLISQTIRRLESANVFGLIGALTYAAFIMPVAAMDQQLALGSQFPIAESMASHQVPTMAIGTCASMLLLCGGHTLGAAKSLVAPLMGITSVLWFMLRNDSAVDPRLAWG